MKSCPVPQADNRQSLALSFPCNGLLAQYRLAQPQFSASVFLTNLQVDAAWGVAKPYAVVGGLFLIAAGLLELNLRN